MEHGMAMDDAAAALAAGGLIVVVDGRAACGFMLGDAAQATAATVNTAVRWGRGLTCFSVDADRAMVLGLLLGGDSREDHRGPIFLRTVEAAACTGTGISAADRALTLRAAGAPDAGIGSLKSPGHVMPVLVGFRGQGDRTSAEAALVVLRRLAGADVAAWTTILDDDGEIADAAHCTRLAERLGLPCLDLDALLAAPLAG